MHRGAGIFLPIFSLPSNYGIGDFGEFSYRFIDIISENGFKLWQILPLNPIAYENYNSPYLSSSLFAGNYLFISLEFLIKEKLIDEKDINLPSFKENEVDYEKVYDFKQKILDISYENFLKFKEKEEFYKFSYENSYWLSDFSLFNVLKRYFKKNWNEWPEKLKKRDEETLKEFERIFKKEIEKEKFIQYIFYKEFSTLKRYANEKNIKIIGDIPIYPSYDSSDVWVNQDIFKLDENKNPIYVAGVPPDYFSEKGQLWGNPVYDWEKLKEKEFCYWIKRIEHS
ncbi:MAG: 4-alpha-glucanotransferase, partial [candidate division WOR-3 bacterium]